MRLGFMSTTGSGQGLVLPAVFLGFGGFDFRACGLGFGAA